MPRIPDSVISFISRVRTGKVRHLQDIYGDELLDSINEEQDRRVIENIIDGTNLALADALAEELADELERRFAAYYPDPEPELVKKIKKVITTEGEILGWDEILGKVEPDVPDDLLGSIEEKYEAALGELPEEQEKNPKLKPQIVLMRCFGEQLKSLFPRRDTSVAKPGSEADDPVWNCAIAALVLGDFTRFDPVIGDEACEARPPFIMDAWQLLMEFFGESTQRLRKLASGYIYRHRKAYSDYDLKELKEGESLWSQAFTEEAAKFKDILSGLYHAGVDYLCLCYANTASSYLATDEWGMVSFDRERNPFGWKNQALKDERIRLQSALSDHSVAYVRAMAAKLAQDHDTPLLHTVAGVLDNANIHRGDKGMPVHCLPIYEIMRTVLAHELAAERPIILSLNQIKCSPQGDSEPRPALYELMLHTLFYKPVNGRYVLAEPPVEESLDYDRPCLAIQAYQMVVEGQAMACSDDLEGFGTIGDAYIETFGKCDISLLVQAYAAVHPPFHHKAEDTNGAIEDQRTYMAKIYEEVTGSGLPSPEPITRDSMEFHLLAPHMDLVTEYVTMHQLGQANDMANKQYITRLLGEDWKHLGSETNCMRALDSCSFSIHHMNVNSWNKVVERDHEARATLSLPRFHDFQSGESIENLG